ncbi:uncharacterized protein LOC115948281 [Geospiza fortis]|uniref:Uncharacterized protein LOC115948281 n=1 Tax=Geospiza fortis TaxID=48883 RepID=A0A8N5ETV3_GEOFO|nr:uncharacterized protein LOC115948281 [Geospiza fortis]
MDSPHLLHLGFLLLALAALHPSIAMSAAGPARWTRGSTTMTLYHCKDCESCKCKDRIIDFNNFTKIAEIQNKKNTIPGVKVELMTNESHITVCFEQANSCPEEIYGVLDETEPPKSWCGILNSRENGGGNINTEDQNVCCEAEADAWRHNPDLKCYIQKSHSKHTALPVTIPDGASSFVWCLRGSSWLSTPACFTWMLCFLLLCSF